MSEKQLLNVKNLYVDVEEKQILHGVDLSIGKGETHVLMGPNGTGKSTLGYALMGNPRYTIKSGEIWFQGKSIRGSGCDFKFIYQKCIGAEDRKKTAFI